MKSPPASGSRAKLRNASDDDEDGFGLDTILSARQFRAVKGNVDRLGWCGKIFGKLVRVLKIT